MESSFQKRQFLLTDSRWHTDAPWRYRRRGWNSERNVLWFTSVQANSRGWCNARLMRRCTLASLDSLLVWSRSQERQKPAGAPISSDHTMCSLIVIPGYGSLSENHICAEKRSGYAESAWSFLLSWYRLVHLQLPDGVDGSGGMWAVINATTEGKWSQLS